MRILLRYFSGTGNTLYITKMLQEKLMDENNTVIISNINEEINDFDYDIIGIGYPIYAFNAPKIFEKSIKELKLFNKPYFIYKTSGEPLTLNNSSSSTIKRIMRKKKNIFLGEYHLIMPYNIIFRFPDRFVEEIMYYNKLYVGYIVNNIQNSKHDIIRSNIFIWIISKIFLIQRFGSKVNSKLYKVDSQKCINCGKCYKNCPVDNIQFINGKISFGYKCQMCMRCSFTCPTNAIKIGFLNKWKVNGLYNLENENNNYFINSESKGFYKYFYKYYQRLLEKLTIKER